MLSTAGEPHHAACILERASLAHLSSERLPRPCFGLHGVLSRSPPRPSEVSSSAFFFRLRFFFRAACSGMGAQAFSAPSPRTASGTRVGASDTSQRTHPGFLSHLTAGLPHVLSCFHPCGVPGPWSWPGWAPRTAQHMVGHSHCCCTTSTSLQGPESSKHCWHTAAPRRSASAAGLGLLLLWASPYISMSHPMASSMNAEEVGLEVLGLVPHHLHSARLFARPSCVQPAACHTAHRVSALSGPIVLALVWPRCSRWRLEFPLFVLLSGFP